MDITHDGKDNWRLGGLLFFLCAASLAATAARGIAVDGTSANLAWMAAPGPVTGYAVFVNRNGAGYPAAPGQRVIAPQATVSGNYGDTVVIKVAAFDSSNNLGPFSPDSALYQFSLDTDGDGIPDAQDNCPYTPNGPLLGTCVGNFPQGQALCHANSDCTSGKCSLNQEDTGGVGTGSPPDGIGDACQCGDVNNDGVVDDTDAMLIKRSVVGLAPYSGGVTTLPGFLKCDVNANGTCDVVDAMIIQRAVAGLAPGVRQRCTAAISH